MSYNLPAYKITENALHRAAQFLMLISKNQASPLPDDSHNTLSLDPDKQVLRGRSFSLDHKGYYGALDIPAFTLELREEHNHEPLFSIPLAGEKIGKALGELKRQMLQFNAFKKGFETQFHYDVPDDFFDPNNILHPLDNQATQLWLSCRKESMEALKRLNQLVGISSEINIWPHHFDTGTYYVLSRDKGKDTVSIGAGWAVPDTMVDEPYFYLYGWHTDEQINYKERPELNIGTWIINDWKGAILPLSSFHEKPQPSEIIHSFFQQAYSFLKVQLYKTL